MEIPMEILTPMFEVNSSRISFTMSDCQVLVLKI